MESSDELLRIDEERWAAFAALVERVPEDRREEPSLNADGWSVKDLLWHMRCWNTVVAEQLEAIAAGTFVGPFDWNTDANNERFLAEGAGVSAATAWLALVAARERSRSAFAVLAEVTPEAEELFSETAFKHTDDHLPELRTFVDRI
jgi:hypothetical protein